MSDLLRDAVLMIAVAALLVAVTVALVKATELIPRRFRESATAAIFLFPAIIAVVGGLLIPALRTIFLSLYDDTGTSFVGLDNYAEIATNNNKRLSVLNSFLWVGVGSVLTLAIGLSVARFADGMKRESAIKSAIFLPGAISLVGAGVIWSFVYAGPPIDIGLLNSVTDVIPGLPASVGGDGDRLWLLERGFGGADPPSAAPGFNSLLLIVIFVWTQAGLAMVLLSAAIKGVPRELIEAARVDGASERQVFWRIVVPAVRPTIAAVLTLTTVAGLKAFDIVSVTTGGNFGTSTIANEFFVTRFVQGRNGLGSALAVLIFALVVPVVLLNQRQERTHQVETGR